MKFHGFLDETETCIHSGDTIRLSSGEEASARRHTCRGSPCIFPRCSSSNEILCQRSRESYSIQDTGNSIVTTLSRHAFHPAHSFSRSEETIEEYFFTRSDSSINMKSTRTLYVTLTFSTMFG